MMDAGIAVASGTAAAELSSRMHTSKTDRHHADILEEICTLIKEATKYLKEKPSGTVEEHIVTYTWLDHAISVGYKKYSATYILVASPSTFTVNVPGLVPFTYTPTVGDYTRWKFPEGTSIQLLTPSNNPSYPVDFLYTYDTSVE